MIWSMRSGEDISDNVGRWKTIVCRWHDPGGVPGDGKHSHLERRHYHQLRACWRSPNRKSLNIRAELAPTQKRRTRRRIMKYIYLGYLEPGIIERMTENERNAMLDDCFAYNDHLRANGHLLAEVPLQPPETALTLYWKNGKVMTADGPYAETKEQVGGIQILEARDRKHAVQLISQHPGFKHDL